jgi:hypothetical protein
MSPRPRRQVEAQSEETAGACAAQPGRRRPRDPCLQPTRWLRRRRPVRPSAPIFFSPLASSESECTQSAGRSFLLG